MEDKGRDVVWNEACDLSRGEKLNPALNNGLLNKRSELISKCRRINKHLLTNTNK